MLLENILKFKIIRMLIILFKLKHMSCQSILVGI